VSGARWPARYEIGVGGVLNARWSDWFDGLQIDSQGGETILSGTFPDQSGLHGILEKVRDLGLSIITVRRLPEEEGENRDETNTHPEASEQGERPWLEVLPLEPRDPYVVRAKALDRSSITTRHADHGGRVQ
jgi:hypothetical protein